MGIMQRLLFFIWNDNTAKWFRKISFDLYQESVATLHWAVNKMDLAIVIHLEILGRCWRARGSRGGSSSCCSMLDHCATPLTRLEIVGFGCVLLYSTTSENKSSDDTCLEGCGLIQQFCSKLATIMGMFFRNVTALKTLLAKVLGCQERWFNSEMNFKSTSFF
jgi:hypothetical protein